MVTTAELNRRGLRYAVVVDGAATPAALADLDDKGLPYLVEVADGATMASRRALEARGLRYLVPVLVDATPASKASLAAQGLRYAVQVDADILPADRLVLQRQGLACYVEVDSSGNSVSAAAVGGAALLVGETDGFATDFTHAVDAERVAKKTAGTVVSSGLSFITSSGTSSKWVYNAAGVLVSIPVGTLPIDYDPVTHAAKGLLCEPQATNYLLQSQTFDNAPWSKGAITIAANAVVAPDGTTTADGIVPPVASGEYMQQAVSAISNGATYTFSAYAKNGTLGNNWLCLAVVSGASYWYVWFNLATGAKGSQLSSPAPPVSYNINSIGGSYRVDMTFVAGATAATCYFIPVNADNASSGVGGNGSSPAFYGWGAQLEPGTVVTSYIPTIAATVTRAVDQYNVTPASIGHSATAGSWWAEWSVPVVVANGRIIGNTSASAPLLMGSNSVGMLDGTTLSKSLTWAVNTTHKAASAYATGDRAVTINGAAVAADAGVVTNLLAPGAAIYFGNGGSTPMNGWLRKVRYLPRRPTNAELVTMST